MCGAPNGAGYICRIEKCNTPRGATYNDPSSRAPSRAARDLVVRTRTKTSQANKKIRVAIYLRAQLALLTTETQKWRHVDGRNLLSL